MSKFFDRLRLAVRRPDLLVRHVRGRDTIEISLDEIASYLPNAPVVIEAGALDGADTVEMAMRWPRGIIHTFEPVPSAFGEVTRRTANLPNVRRYQIALADRTEGRTMYVSGTVDGRRRPDSSSLLRPTGHLEKFPEVVFSEMVDVQSSTLSDWAVDAGVEHVDFLWLDMQGMELPVLQASPEFLETASAVCMEVSRRELYAGTALYPEVVEWMADHGFRPAIDRVAVAFGNILFVKRGGAG